LTGADYRFVTLTPLRLLMDSSDDLTSAFILFDRKG